MSKITRGDLHTYVVYISIFLLFLWKKFCYAICNIVEIINIRIIECVNSNYLFQYYIISTIDNDNR